MPHFGQKLRDLIVGRKLENEAFAQKAGIGADTLYRNLRSAEPVGRAVTYQLIAEALDMTKEQLDAAWKPPTKVRAGNIGQIARQIMRERGKSQRDVTNAGGLDVAELTRLFASDDIGELHHATVQAFAKALDMNYVDLVSRLKPGSIQHLKPGDEPSRAAGNTTPEKEKNMSIEEFRIWLRGLSREDAIDVYALARAKIEALPDATNTRQTDPARTGRKTG